MSDISIPTWLQQVYDLHRDGRTLRAGQVLYHEIDRLLRDGEHAQCDVAIAQIDVEQLDTNLLVTLLGATKGSGLQSRATLVQRIEKKLQQLAPDRWERLTANLV